MLQFAHLICASFKDATMCNRPLNIEPPAALSGSARTNSNPINPVTIAPITARRDFRDTRGDSSPLPLDRESCSWHGPVFQNGTIFLEMGLFFDTMGPGSRTFAVIAFTTDYDSAPLSAAPI